MPQSFNARLNAAKAEVHEPEVKGHAIDDVARFMEATRHMIVIDVLDYACPVGDKGDRLRIFLSNEGYADAMQSQEKGACKILRHARVKDGALCYDTPGKAYE